MKDFFARIELHGARWPDDYKTLHDELLKYGFRGRIASTTGELLLPSGFYYSVGKIDELTQALRAAKACADATGFTNEVIVISGAPWAAYLSKAQSVWKP